MDETMVRKWTKDGHSYDSISEMLKSSKYLVIPIFSYSWDSQMASIPKVH